MIFLFLGSSLAHLEPELELFEVDDIGVDGDGDLSYHYLPNWAQYARGPICLEPKTTHFKRGFPYRKFTKCQAPMIKILPKAQRTRGLRSACQSNLFRSYHKFKHKSWSNFIFRILTRHQLQNINQTSDDQHFKGSFWAFLAILGVSKMALRVPESKF